MQRRGPLEAVFGGSGEPDEKSNRVGGFAEGQEEEQVHETGTFAEGRGPGQVVAIGSEEPRRRGSRRVMFRGMLGFGCAVCADRVARVATFDAELGACLLSQVEVVGLGVIRQDAVGDDAPGWRTRLRRV
jgi:hypothetical protein